MKNLKRILCLSLALICLTLSLTSCSNRMVMTGAGLENKKTGISYSYVLNPAYQPVEYAGEPYTKWKYNKISVEYFAIKGLKEEEWLYCPTLGEVLCSTGEELPELGGFDANGALICIEAAIPYSIYEIKDQEFIDKIDYLEIGSAGLERPIRRIGQLEMSLGKKVKVKTYKLIEGAPSKAFSAVLKEFDGEKITLDGDLGTLTLTAADISGINYDDFDNYDI